MKKHYFKLPFWIKLFWAKRLLRTAKTMQYMFTGFGPNFNNDIILHNRINSMNEELELWIKTEGRPSTSNVDYQINTH